MKRVLFFLFKTIKKLMAGRGLRKCRLVDRVYRSSLRILRPKGELEIKCYGHNLTVNADDRGVALPLILGSGYEDYEAEVVEAFVRPSMLVVDIGANVGVYTLLLGKLVGQDGQVFAFEPEPKNFALLRRNIEQNGYTNITPVPKAISNRRGRLRLHRDKVNLGAHSIAKANLLDATDSVEVDTLTLDEFVASVPGDKSVDFIKMDVQGAEGLVVEGAEKTLKAPNVAQMIEFWPYGPRNLGTDPLQFLETLCGYGFRPSLIDGQRRCRQQVSPREIIEMCECGKEGRGFRNILLEK